MKQKNLAGAQDIRITFEQSADQEGGTKLCPLALVSYILNCITYNFSADRVKAGIRGVQLSISDNINPVVGTANVSVEVVPPLIHCPSLSLENSYMIGSKRFQFAQKNQYLYSPRHPQMEQVESTQNDFFFL